MDDIFDTILDRIFDDSVDTQDVLDGLDTTYIADVDDDESNDDYRGRDEDKWRDYRDEQEPDPMDTYAEWCDYCKVMCPYKVYCDRPRAADEHYVCPYQK